ncbi:hypothetical protein [Paenibacillus sp. WLX2291]|uniref:hypothetical protein n=1 Tax=Paenibacillus sp. WLX2291 TaxID=3296934 RepID=UPI003983F38C
MKNHITLISRNIQNNRIEEAKEALQLLKTLKLNPHDLKSYYYGTALNELVFLAFKQEFINLFLDEFINLINLEPPQDSGLILSLYDRMIMNSIEKNDVKLLSKVIYKMTTNHVESRRADKKINEVGLKLSEIPLPMIRAVDEDIIKLKAKIYSIYLAAIKCIELSQYAQVGFIIKFLVTNFDGELIKEVYIKLEEGLIEKEIDTNMYYENIAKLSVSIDLNKKTIDYCFRKFSLLLYFQQRYVLQARAVLDKEVKVKPYIPIFQLVVDTPYINYMYEKIMKSKDKYGLLYLNDKEFLGNIKRSILKKD